MKKILKILTESIKSALCAESFGEKKRLSAEETSDVLYLSIEHDIAALAGVGLESAGYTVGGEFDAVFTNHMMAAVYRYEKMNYDLGRIRETLGKANIPYIPLKGSVLREYYPEPWMRTSCDIDILVHTEDTERAIDALCAVGFERQEDSTKYDCSLMTPGGVHVELHYDLNTHGIFPGVDEILADVWSHTVPYDGCECRMTNEMFVFYHIAHMAKHFVHGGCGIRPFADLLAMRGRMPYDRNKLDEMLENSSLSRFYAEVLGLCGVWFDGKAHTQITERMEEFILTGGVYGTVENNAVVRAAKGEGKTAGFFKLVFLPYSNLSVIYPKLKKCPYLFLYYQVKRWFGIFESDRRHKITNITEARADVTSEAADGVKHMLDDLGL